MTDFGTPKSAGDSMWLIFDAAASVVDSSTITVVGNANFQAAANDMALVYALTTSTFLFTPFPNAGSYTPIDTINNTHLKNAFVGDHTEVTVATGDSILIGDVSDSGNTKRDTVQGLLDLVPAAATTHGTLTASTSGTSIDFGSIPAGVTHIRAMYNVVSLSGTASHRFQLGDGGGIETSGYGGAPLYHSGNGSYTNGAVTAGLEWGPGQADNTMSATVCLDLMDPDTFLWSMYVIGASANDNNGAWSSSSKALSAELTQVRFTTSTGSDTFDAGSVNISYWK